LIADPNRTQRPVRTVGTASLQHRRLRSALSDQRRNRLGAVACGFSLIFVSQQHQDGVGGEMATDDADELAPFRQTLADLLATLRKEASLTQQQVADRLGYSRTTVAGAETGHRLPGKAFWAAADDVLAPGGELRSAYAQLAAARRDRGRQLERQAEVEREARVARWREASNLPRNPAAATPAALSADPVTGAAVGSRAATRREVLGFVGAGVMGVGLQHLGTGLGAGRPRVLEALEVTGQTSPPDRVDSLLGLIEHYKGAFRRTPPAQLYDEMLAVRGYAGSLHAGQDESRDLAVALGWLSNLLALVTHDLGDLPSAHVWCSDAERRGQQSGHLELAGWAAHTRVLTAFYIGRAREAVAHAQRGQTLAALGTVAHAKLVAQEMRAWALLGDPHMVTHTRSRAEKAIAELPADPPAHGAFSISLANDPPYTATSLLLLGRFQEAEDLTRQVIATFYGPGGGDGPGQHPSGFARTYLALALALAGLGRLDEARAAGGGALSVTRLDWPVVVLAGKLDQALTRDFAGTIEARDYHQQYIAVIEHHQSRSLPASAEAVRLDGPQS